MAMVRYEPWGMGALQNQINRLFNDWGDTESSAATASWMPPVDIHEYGDRFQLFVDLPGVDPKEVEITLDNGVLTITGERYAQAPAEGEKAMQRRSERGIGRFYRRFILPDTVDSEKVRANDRNGVLEIAIPKQAKAQPRRIEVAA
jgi:HSP20 family protein